MNTNFEIIEPDRLLTDFHRLTGIKVCICDSEGREINFYPDRFTKFCGYVRNHPNLDKKCRDCDMNAIAECRRTHRPKIYTCHAGLTECYAPILIGDSIMGFIATGQIRENDCKLPALDVENKELLYKYYNELQIIERAKMEAALHVLVACAGYERLKTFVSQTTESFATRFEAFIDSNL